MRLPYANPKRNKVKPVIYGFQGLNRNSVISDNQISASWNMSSRELPCLVTRPPREVYTTLSKQPNALFASEKLCWVDGTDFVWDGMVKGTVANGPKSIVDFNGRIVIFPDKKYYDYIEDEFGNVGNGTEYPAEGSCPDIDVACVHNNRIFGLKGSNIYACALGNMQDWTTFVDENGDPSEVGAYATDVASDGSFTGCVEYQGHVVMLKPDFCHELYGQRPGNFNVLQVSKTGGLTQNSITEVKSLLYFLSRDGIMRYSGGQPAEISQDLNETFISGASGTDGRMYYISLETKDGKKLYVYDTQNDVWMQEDNLDIIQFARWNGSLYAMAADKKIYKFNSGTEKFHWWFETADFTDDYFGKKVNTGISYRVELAEDTFMTVSVKTDGGMYKDIKTITNKGNKQMYLVDIPPLQCERIKIKFSGYGTSRIYGMSRNVTIGSDRV